jgi:sulfur relay (sulfurtransferase) DsrF/TusC family protein
MQNPIDTSLNPYSVAGTLGFEELAIALVANQFSSSILQMDFLKMSGMIPSDWELQKQPVLTASVAQLIFKNGVSLVAQARNVSFTQTIDAKNENALKIPELVRQFLEKLPNADYQGISINPKIVVAFPQGKESARKYIVEKLLSPGPWTHLGIAPIQAAVNFFYQLERCKLLVNLNEAQIQQPNQQPMSALLFSGSFNYDVASYTVDERLQRLKLYQESWSKDLETFRQIVLNTFLGQQDSVFTSK